MFFFALEQDHPNIVVGCPTGFGNHEEGKFGPLVPVVVVYMIHESFALVNSVTKPLAAYLFSNDSKHKRQFARNVSAGTFSFEAFTHKRVVREQNFLGEAKGRYPP
ncbi:unnamed protein product [Urochloa humidicola]